MEYSLLITVQWQIGREIYVRTCSTTVQVGQGHYRSDLIKQAMVMAATHFAVPVEALCVLYLDLQPNHIA